MNLYNLKENYNVALNNLFVDIDTGEIQGMEELQSIEDDIDSKLLNYGKYIKSIQAEHFAFKEEKKRCDFEMKKRDLKVSALKEIITQNLKSDKKLEDSQCKLSYRKSQRLLIDDFDLLPNEFISFTPKVDKTLLKEALKNKVISGASIKDFNNLQIK